jgi:hypothetical protein
MSHDDAVSNDVLDAALRLQDFCRGQGWRFCFIGGLAVQKWSEPRVTDDVDLTLFTGFGTEEPFIEALLALDWLEPRIPRAREFARERRVLLLETKGGVGIDIALGAFPFEEEAIRRGQEVALLPGRVLRLCTAEDLIVFKAFAARPQDWRDVEMTIVRQGDDALDWRYVHQQLRPLLELKEEPELFEKLEDLRLRLRSAKTTGDV